jgi:hypothetical protein
MRSLSFRRLAAVGLLAWAAVAASWFGTTRTGTLSADRNGDGRVDVWRIYDQQGQLVESAVDSNFDGRSDVREYYAHGELVRRESDRNFDDRVDLVEEFDANTHERVRSIVDSDFDGTADLLVLFQRGRPVFSRWASPRPHSPDIPHRVVPPSTFPARSGDEPMAQLDDPFAGDTAFRAVLVTPDRPAATPMASGWFLCPTPAFASLTTVSEPGSSLEVSTVVARSIPLRSLRSPPLA